MRRAVAIRVLGAIVVSAALIGSSAASPAFACGCGGVVGPADSTVSISNERAIIHWDGDVETMEIMVDMSSDVATTGIIIPTPSPARVSEGDARTFALIEDGIEPVTRVVTDPWGLGYLFPDAVDEEPTSVERVTVGPLEATTIAAADAAGLETWLAANEFQISETLTKSLASYAELGWSFTAIKLTGEKAMNGHVDPIRLSFATERLVYPMRLAKSETTPQSVRLYVFDKQRTGVSKASSPTIDIDGKVSVVWAGEQQDARLVALGAYLTVFDISYEVPDEEVTSDLGFVYSLSEKDVQTEIIHYQMITLFGIPVGTLIVVWTLLGIGLSVGHVVGRRRAR